MATARIKTVSRGQNRDSFTDTIIDDDFLRVEVITSEDQEAGFNLYFADHAGLEAEWTAGLVITVLDAAVDSWVSSTMSTADDDMASGARGGKEAYDFTIP